MELHEPSMRFQRLTMTEYRLRAREITGVRFHQQSETIRIFRVRNRCEAYRLRINDLFILETILETPRSPGYFPSPDSRPLVLQR